MSKREIDRRYRRTGNYSSTPRNSGLVNLWYAYLGMFENVFVLCWARLNSCCARGWVSECLAARRETPREQLLSR
jgi:hypothetical protein